MDPASGAASTIPNKDMARSTSPSMFHAQRPAACCVRPIWAAVHRPWPTTLGWARPGGDAGWDWAALLVVRVSRSGCGSAASFHLAPAYQTDPDLCAFLAVSTSTFPGSLQSAECRLQFLPFLPGFSTIGTDNRWQTVIPCAAFPFGHPSLPGRNQGQQENNGMNPLADRGRGYK